jgi:two-component system chemotaxis response regulator CheB
MMEDNNRYQLVVIGVSAGGLQALKEIFMNVSKDFRIPVIIVQHMHANSDTFMSNYLDKLSPLTVKEAEEKEKIKPGTVYIAPPNYHLLVEQDRAISLTLDGKVNYCRPSVDVLFESAADAFGSELVGIILTGSNSDGAEGMKSIKEKGGLLLVQDPTTAEMASMPMAVIRQTQVDHVLGLDKIAPFLNKLANNEYKPENKVQ